MSAPRGYGELNLISPPMKSDMYFEWVEQSAALLEAVEPWTLLRLPGEVHYCVAVRRTWWWRIVTRVRNIGRRWTRKAYDRSFARRSQQ